LPIWPASLVPILPLHDVVPRVHRVDALWQKLDLEPAPQARAVERLLPPFDPLQRGCSNRLGDAAIDVIANRFLDRRVAVVRVHSLEAMPSRPAHHEWFLDRRRLVVERAAEAAHT